MLIVGVVAKVETGLPQGNAILTRKQKSYLAKKWENILCSKSCMHRGPVGCSLASSGELVDRYWSAGAVGVVGGALCIGSVSERGLDR